jgi:ribosomal protein S18 acetylase RimI-like enzyme
VEIREARVSDADGMSQVLEELIAAGKRTKPGDPKFALSHYIEHPDRLHCFVALHDHSNILGFQSLKIASEGNPYGTCPGWGIIGTHVRPSAARMGVGSRLFTATLNSAREAGLPAIEAYIGAENDAALAYYEAVGFTTYRTADGVVCKALHLADR